MSNISHYTLARDVDSAYAAGRVGVDYKSPITITITITVPIQLSITITITVVIEKAITITITIIRLRLRLQLLVYHGNDPRLFIQHVHLQYYHAWLSENVNNQTFILHPGLSINREIRVFPRAVGNTGKYRKIGNPCPHNFIKHCYLYLTWNYLQQW